MYINMIRIDEGSYELVDLISITIMVLEFIFIFGQSFLDSNFFLIMILFKCRYQPDPVSVVTAGPSMSNYMAGWLP